jgi:predicted nucleotidyltransferase
MTNEDSLKKKSLNINLTLHILTKMDIYKLNFTKLEIEIFSYLCIRVGEELSQRDIAKMLKVSPTAISNSVKKLKKENLIKIKKTKNINFISFNRDYKKAIQLKRVENLKFIYSSGLIDFIEENLAGSTIILFGSYSKGEDTIKSDIDIAIIENKKKDIQFEKFEKILFRKININFYDSWKDINKHLRNNILNGVVISGSVNI